MINANELRLGNWVSNGEKYFTVDISSLYDIGAGITDKIIEPIPLTEDLLGKCGFVKELLDADNPKEGYWYYKDLSNDKYCDLSLCSGDKNGICEVTLFPYNESFRFQYLHQIQNVWHALTGQELTITNL